MRRSVLSPGVHLHSYAEVEDSILFPGADVARSAVVRRAILDKDVCVLEGAQVGVDHERDRERGFTVSDGGVTVVGKGAGGGAVKVALLTREFPPDVYGGAGVHVEYLARELARLEELTVHAWGADRDGVVGHRAWDALAGDAPHLSALRAMSIDLSMTAGAEGAELVHSHTWYANLAGHLAKLTYDIPHVATVHSLEPLRPWKAEQLGGGYALSSWCEKVALESADAVIAVSEGMRRDVLEAYPALDPARVQVIYNGIDAEQYAPDRGTDVLERWGVDADAPSVVFVGRITRQKGVPYLVEAALQVDPAAQIVLCAGAPDTPEIAEEVRRRRRAAALRARRRDLDRGDAPEGRRDPAALPRHRVRVPVDLRAAGDRQPRGDGVRDRGRGERGRRDRRGRRRRRHGAAGAAGDRARARWSRPTARGSSAGLAAGINALVRDPDRAAAMGRAGRGAGRRALRLAGDRRADLRALPLAQLPAAIMSGSVCCACAAGMPAAAVRSSR